MTNISDRRQHYRITGPVENFVTAAVHGMWAFNPGHKRIWGSLQPDDICFFHATGTGTSPYTNERSSIIGYGIVGTQKWEKSNFVWLMEFKDKENLWPFAFNFSEIHFFCGPTTDLDLQTPLEVRTKEETKYSISQVYKGAKPLADLIIEAKEIDKSIPDFPTQGSSSKIRPAYLTALENHSALNVPHVTLLYESNLPGEAPVDSPTRILIEKKLAELNKQELLAAAQNHKSTGESHRETNGARRVRVEDQQQKGRIALIEKHTCQVCLFKCEYEHKDELRYVIEIDHIRPKSKGGDEHIDNLWALCPNCHTKKTRGIIKIDRATGCVTERGEKIIVRNHHLSWLDMTEG